MTCGKTIESLTKSLDRFFIKTVHHTILLRKSRINIGSQDLPHHSCSTPVLVVKITLRIPTAFIIRWQVRHGLANLAFPILSTRLT